MTRSPIVRMIGALVAASLAVACANDAASTGEPTSMGDAATAGDASNGGATASFPVEVEAANGTVRIVSAPRRIVSLSPSLTEMLFAIGASDQVVAVDQHSDFPAGVPRSELSGFRPNLEAIGGYEPDLVVLARDREGVAGALATIGVATIVLPSASTIDDVYEQLRVLGAATGHVEAADEVVAEIADGLAAIAGDAADRGTRLRYFYELSDQLHTVTSDTFVGELLGLAGMVSIADEVDDAAGGFPQLSAEYVLQANPDVIFLAHGDGTGQDPAEVGRRAGWEQLGAVREGNVILLDGDLASRWGPRIVDLLRSVVDGTADVSSVSGG